MNTVTVHANSSHSREELFDRWLRFDLVPDDGWSFEVTTDPRVGGKYEAIFNAPGGERHVHRGEYRVIDRPSKLVFTWISEGTKQQETVVTIDFDEVAGGSEMTLTHDGVPTKELADSHAEGWGRILALLSESGRSK
jgi:uncharacterized protein YndB with AHSA1/START domain